MRPSYGRGGGSLTRILLDRGFGFVGLQVLLCGGWCVVGLGFALWPRCVQMGSTIQKSDQALSKINEHLVSERLWSMLGAGGAKVGSRTLTRVRGTTFGVFFGGKGCSKEAFLQREMEMAPKSPFTVKNGNKINRKPSKV